MSMNRSRILLGSIVALVCLEGPLAQAAEDVITGVAPAWATTAAWSLGALPGINDNAVIRSTGVLDLRGSAFNGTIPPNYTEIQDLTFDSGTAMTLTNNSTSVNMTLGLNGGRGADVPLIQTIGDFVYTVTGTNTAATPHTLAFQLKSGGEIRIAGAGRLDLNAVVTEVDTLANLNKTGTGILNLGSVNVYTGGTSVSAGTLEAAVAGALGSGTVSVSPGAQLALRNVTLTNSVLLNGGTLLTRTGDLSNFSGNVAASGNSAVVLRSYTTPVNDLSITISGALTGSGTLTVNGNASNATSAKALILTNPANAFGGTFQVTPAQTLRSAPALTGNTLGTAAINLDGGTLQLRDDGAGDAGTLTYGNNLLLQGTGGTVNVDHATINSGNVIQLGTLTLGAQTLNVTGANGYGVRFGDTTLTGAATFNPVSAPVTLGGVVSGAFGIIKTGAGNLVL
ncbi:MAG: putative autotransporter, partial [Chthoniobacteraceae bacterium]|nr:putative autotransporter [Chthoniobacteraceae bacterium]